MKGITVQPDKVNRGGFLMPVASGSDQARKMEDIQRVIRESGCRVLPTNWLMETVSPREFVKTQPGDSQIALKGVNLSAAVLAARGRSLEPD